MKRDPEGYMIAARYYGIGRFSPSRINQKNENRIYPGEDTDYLPISCCRDCRLDCKSRDRFLWHPECEEGKGIGKPANWEGECTPELIRVDFIDVATCPTGVDDENIIEDINGSYLLITNTSDQYVRTGDFEYYDLRIYLETTLQADGFYRWRLSAVSRPLVIGGAAVWKFRYFQGERYFPGGVGACVVKHLQMVNMHANCEIAVEVCPPFEACYTDYQSREGTGGYAIVTACHYF